jgi:hypothetical protein
VYSFLLDVVRPPKIQVDANSFGLISFFNKTAIQTMLLSPSNPYHRLSLLLSLLTLLPNQSSALIETIPRLDTLASRMTGGNSNRLNYRIAVGDKEQPFQMKNMHIELTDAISSKKKGSTGIHNCNLLQKPTFVNDLGEQSVPLTNGGWEITWAPNSPHGILTCSFIAPEAIKRNDAATLEKGRFFMRHRVWTRKTIESERDRRRSIQSEAAKFLDERDQKITQITDTNDSLASKTWSYAQAAKSMNSYYDLGVYDASFVPLYDDQVLELLRDDCIVSSRGQVFKVQNRREGPVYVGESRVESLS